MKNNILSGLLVSAIALSITACGGSASRTASDPTAAEIAAHSDEDPTLPNKVIDLRSATAFAGEGTSSTAQESTEATASK